MTSGNETLPSFALVTPSLNCGRFIERTIRSVLDQNYPNLRYAVVDGGSSDNTGDVLARWKHKIDHVLIEPDGGMYDALNKGFANIDADIMGWINADDLLLPGTLRLVGSLFRQFPEMEWLTTLYPCVIDEHDAVVKLSPLAQVSSAGIRRGDYLPIAGWYGFGFIQQEGTFWRRSLWQRAGARVDSSLSAAGDYELWCRFAPLAEIWGVDVPLAGFRYHPNQKTSRNLAEYKSEALRITKRSGYSPRFRWLHNLRILGIRACPGRIRYLLDELGLRSRGPEITYDWWGRQWRKH
ncbi:MAG: glycosyltransferase [Phycisphaeraceae bacterium]|nr:glycosyltransferase [Phycisphaeraceae bacterium]